MMPGARIPATTVAILFFCASVAAAQTDAADREAMQQQERLIETFLDHATTELNLTVEQRGQLRQVLEETMDRRAELARSQIELRRQIRDALADPSSGDERFRRLAESTLELRNRDVELLRWQQERLLQVLTPRQALRFMLMQERLAQRIAELRRSRRQ
jgi:Spy/CpxP family protein refolding chaperone